MIYFNGVAVLAGAFSSVHVRWCGTYPYAVDASGGAEVVAEWSHERLRVESIMSRDVFLSRTCLPIIHIRYRVVYTYCYYYYYRCVRNTYNRHMYIVVLYRIIYLLLLRCCLDGNDVSAACPMTSDDYTRDTSWRRRRRRRRRRRTVIKTQNATAVCCIIVWRVALTHT